MDDEADSDNGGRVASNSKTKANRPRTRVSRACDRCRSKKDKCDGQRPKCSACAIGGHVCLYDPSTKKRGLPEGYVRGIEKLWALAFGKIEGFESVVTGLLDDKEQLLQLWNHETVGDELHEAWKTSSTFRSLEELLGKLESDGQSSQVLRSKSEQDFTANDDVVPVYHRQPAFSVVSKQDIAQAAADEPSTSNGLHRLSAATNMLSTTDGLAGLGDLPPRKRQRLEQGRPEEVNANVPIPSVLSLPTRASKMLDFYFSYTHCWLPIIERHQVLRVSYEYSDGPVDLSSVSTADHAALWSMLALSSRQYIRAFQIANQGASPTTDTDPDSFYRVARSLVPNEGHKYESGHVQALLLLAFVDYGCGRLSASWLLIGQAVRIAMDLDLGSQQQGKNIYLGCFVLDTLISARLGRTPHLRPDKIVEEGVGGENGLDEWDPWKDYTGSVPEHKPAFILSNFNRILRVFMIINDVICKNSSDSHTFCESQMQRLLSIAHERADLTAWIQSPRRLREEPILPHQMILITYLKTAELLINMHAFSHRIGFANQDSLPPEAYSRVPRDMLELLIGYETHRFLFLLPPLVEYSVRLAFQVVVLSKESFSRPDDNPESISFRAWVESMSSKIDPLQPCWPALYSLNDSMQKEAYMAQLVGSTPTQQGLPLQHQMYSLTPLTPSSIKTSDRYQSQTSQGNYQLNLSSDLTPALQFAPTWNNQPTNMSMASQMRMSPSSPMASRSAAGSDVPMSTIDPSLTVTPKTSTHAGIAVPVGDVGDQAPATYSTSVPMDMSNDIDAIFDDLAHLDTTDWASERDHTFKDFGFNDESTFRAFLDDPERLFASNNNTPFMSSQHSHNQKGHEGTGSSSLSAAMPEDVSSNSTTWLWPRSRFVPGSAAVLSQTTDIVGLPQHRESVSQSGSSGHLEQSQLPALPEGVGW